MSSNQTLSPPQGPEYTPCACSHIEPEHDINGRWCAIDGCECSLYRPAATSAGPAPATDQTADRAAVYREVAARLAADAETGDKDGLTRIYRRSAAKQVRTWAEELAGDVRQDEPPCCSDPTCACVQVNAAGRCECARWEAPADQAAEVLTPADLVTALRGAGAEKDKLHDKEVRELRRKLATAERIWENADFHLGQEMARRQLAEKEAARLRADRAAVLREAADAPAAECSAQHRGFDDGRLCIRAAQHHGDHIDERGYHWSDTVAVYPLADGAFRTGINVRAELRRLADETPAEAQAAAPHTDETTAAEMRATIERLRGELAEEMRKHNNTIAVAAGRTVDAEESRAEAARLRAELERSRAAGLLSTALTDAGLPVVKGSCPACRRASLFLGTGGYPTCSNADCTEPDAATTVLEQYGHEAHAPEHTWSAELYDPLADEWVPGTRYIARDRAVNHLNHANAIGPTWKDGTPVQRRLVRATTTYTVEQPAAEARQDGDRT